MRHNTSYSEGLPDARRRFLSRSRNKALISASCRKGLNGVLAGLQGGLGLVAICSDGLLDGKLATASMTPGLTLPTRAEFDVVRHFVVAGKRKRD